MVFSSVTFIYWFIPALFIVYYLTGGRYKNLVLLIFSLLFYFYGDPVYTLLLIGASLSGYIHGRLIERFSKTPLAKGFLVSSIVVGIGLLGFFKYADFFLENLNLVLNRNFVLLRLALPLGISFYTFQVLSYTIDVYKGEVTVQKNVLSFMMYVAMFPQLIAGPIVRYEDVEKEINHRTHSLKDVHYGLRRFIIGLAKKVLIANTLGEVLVHFDAASEVTVLFAWLAAIAFTLQIYFDFSGYSDMAIGLGRMLGFHFPENFKHPYISKSVSEFWRRWHISLGTWFRKYLYIPLGGNRVKTLYWIRNILVVWFLTGFWHGAAWNFILWGTMYGVLLLFEKMIVKDKMKKVPAFLRHAYVMFVVVVGFVLFNANSLSEGLYNIGSLFGVNGLSVFNGEALHYTANYLIIILVGAIGATPLARNLLGTLKRKRRLYKILNWVEPVVMFVL
jgi:alginate O-acetyltransferase complex protein AlgI